MNLNAYLTPYTKINLDWIIDLNIRTQTTKFLEEYIGDDLKQILFLKYFMQTKFWNLCIRYKE